MRPCVYFTTLASSAPSAAIVLDGIGLGNGTLFCLRTANQQNPQSRCLNPKLSAMIEVLRGIEVFVARIPDRKDANAVLCIPARRANEEKGRNSKKWFPFAGNHMADASRWLSSQRDHRRACKDGADF